MPVRRRWPVVATVLFLVLAGGVTWAFWPSSDETTAGTTPSSPPDAPAPTPTAGTPASAGTTATTGTVPGEEAAGIDGEQNAPGGASEDLAVTLTIATLVPDGSAVEVSGYVDTLGQGTCTATVAVGSARSTASGPTYADASSTSCGTLSVPVADLPGGTATVTLTYSSAGLSATSAPTSLDLP